MKIIVDVDEQLVQTIPSLIEFYHATIDPTAKLNPKVHSSGWHVWNGDKSKNKDFYYSWVDSEFFTKLKPVPGSIKAIKELKQDGHQLFIVSAVKPDTIIRQRRADFLESIYGTGSFTDIVTVNHGNKLPEMQRLGGQALIDDEIQYLHQAIDNGMHAVSVQRPSNREALLQLGNQVTIAKYWRETPAIFRTLSR